jgi:hypothetical protein
LPARKLVKAVRFEQKTVVSIYLLSLKPEQMAQWNGLTKQEKLAFSQKVIEMYCGEFQQNLDMFRACHPMSEAAGHALAMSKELGIQ